MVKVLRISAYMVFVAAALLVGGAAQSYYLVGHIPSGMMNIDILFSVPMLVALVTSALVLKFSSAPTETSASVVRGE